jgi:hypothetical protein
MFVCVCEVIFNTPHHHHHILLLILISFMSRKHITHFLCLGVVGNKKHMIDRNLLCGIICMRISQNAITYGNCHLSMCISLSIFQSTILVGKCFFYMTLSTTCFLSYLLQMGIKCSAKLSVWRWKVAGWSQFTFVISLVSYPNTIFRGFFLNQWWGTWVISGAHTHPLHGGLNHHGFDLKKAYGE